MRKSLGVLLVVTVSSVLLLVGCSQSPKAGSDAVDLVPRTANMIGHLKLDQIVQDEDVAAMYQALPMEVGAPQTAEEALAASIGVDGLDLSGFEESWAFGDVSQIADNVSYFGAILKGSYDEEALLTELGSTLGEGFTSIDCQGYEVYTDSDQKAGLALLASDMVVAGSIQAVKDVIAVKERDEPCFTGDLRSSLEDLNDSLVKAAVAVPEGLLARRLQAAGGSNILLLSVMDAFSAMQTVTMTMAKDGESIVCSFQFGFADSESAEGVRTLIQLAPQMMGSLEIPEGSLGVNQQEALALMVTLLGKSDSSVSDSCLTVSFAVTTAELEEAFPEESDRDDDTNGAASGLAVDLAVHTDNLTAKGLGISVKATITNRTALTFGTGDMKLTATGGAGQMYMQTTIAGASVAANSNTAFQTAILIPLEILGEKDLWIAVDTTAESAGISIPLNASVTLTLPQIESLIAVPGIDLTVDIGDLSPDGLDVSLQAAISNANPFALEVGDLLTTFKGQSGNIIATSTMQGCSIAGNSARTLSGHFLVPLEVLNENTLVSVVQTQAGFAGVTLPVSAKITVNMPDIDSLIAPPVIEAYTEAKWLPHILLPRLRLIVSSHITNNANLGLTLGDIQASFFDADGNVVAEMTIVGGEIEASSNRTFAGSVTLSSRQYWKLLAGDYFVLKVAGEAGISGVNATIPIAATMTVAMSSLLF
jgi:hypothetical protein